jgi:hypothetical protein
MAAKTLLCVAELSGHAHDKAPRTKGYKVTGYVGYSMCECMFMCMCTEFT